MQRGQRQANEKRVSMTACNSRRSAAASSATNRRRECRVASNCAAARRAMASSRCRRATTTRVERARRCWVDLTRRSRTRRCARRRAFEDAQRAGLDQRLREHAQLAGADEGGRLGPAASSERRRPLMRHRAARRTRTAARREWRARMRMTWRDDEHARRSDATHGELDAKSATSAKRERARWSTARSREKKSETT